MSGIAGIDYNIDILVSKEVSIPKIIIGMRYQKISISELGIEISKSINTCKRYPNRVSKSNDMLISFPINLWFEV